MSDEKEYTIRVHTATVETRYGMNRAQLYDCPINPLYTDEEVIDTLMYTMDFEKTEDEDSWSNGRCNGHIDAHFAYEGYEDIRIPNAIVQRIIAEASK